MTDDLTRARLEYLRGEIEAERISYEEIAELQGFAEHIDPSDTVLLQWAGVPEDRAMALAEAQAAKDRELLASLNERSTKEPVPQAAEQAEVVEQPKPKPMNRAERRQQVAYYAKALAASERQTPIVNPTIIPKNKRRRRG